jgi:hypothetical protein
MKTRDEQITERRLGVPSFHKKKYDKAVKGKSLRACINAQCLECVGWIRKEVRLCTDLACPLYPVRPCKDEQTTQDEPSTDVGCVKP